MNKGDGCSFYTSNNNLSVCVVRATVPNCLPLRVQTRVPFQNKSNSATFWYVIAHLYSTYRKRKTDLSPLQQVTVNQGNGHCNICTEKYKAEPCNISNLVKHKIWLPKLVQCSTVLKFPAAPKADLSTTAASAVLINVELSPFMNGDNSSSFWGY